MDNVTVSHAKGFKASASNSVNAEEYDGVRQMIEQEMDSLPKFKKQKIFEDKGKQPKKEPKEPKIEIHEDVKAKNDWLK
eukprot:5702114-Alexandrium_andersonii.AAC.1